MQVRELRYAPLDREYSTQILNSFNMELALAASAAPAPAAAAAGAGASSGDDDTWGPGGEGLMGRGVLAQQVLAASDAEDGQGFGVDDGSSSSSSSSRSSTEGLQGGGSGARACSAQSIAGLAWALSYTKHKKKFVHANRAGLLRLAEAAERRCGKGVGEEEQGRCGTASAP